LITFQGIRNLFAFAVPIFAGNQLFVFEGCFFLPLGVVKK